MPLKQCTKDGKPGWQWGDKGTCYTGKQGKSKAMRQGQAIEASKAEDKPAPKKKAARKKKES